MKTIDSRVMHCATCGHDTVHVRNATSVNWIMHLFMTIITFGVWLIVAIPVLLFSLCKVNVGGWRCSVCGK